jgi:lipoprotein-anchoring transpeptidase ErfK/SrfK
MHLFDDGITTRIAEARALAQAGDRQQARIRFAQVLDADPNHIEAALWLAALSPEPQESIRLLNRVLEIAPGHPQAIEGLRWARRQQRTRVLDPRPVEKAKVPLLDKILLSGVVLVSLAACIFLAAIAWGAPEAVRAAQQPLPTATPTWTPTATPTLTPTYTPTPTPSPIPTYTPTSVVPTATATDVVPGEPPSTTLLGLKWIELDLSAQKLTAYEGETKVYSALVSTGIASMPTPLGEHRIYRKIRSQVMSGPGYYLPNVEWVSYFIKGYAIHGTYWHNNFGHPMSHGCVNMTNDDAKWIYEWAPLHTKVVVIP